MTSMKYEFGDCTRRLSLCCFFSNSAEGFRRSTARVYRAIDEMALVWGRERHLP